MSERHDSAPIGPAEHQYNCGEGYHVVKLVSHQTRALIVQDCRDCGDVCLLEPSDRGRCETCQQLSHDEAREVVNRALDRMILTNPDEVDILCDSCCELATSFDARTTDASALDGKAHVCESCGEHGRLVMHDDEGSCWLQFRPYTKRELMDAAALCEPAAAAGHVCKECLEPGGLDADGICNECKRGW